MGAALCVAKLDASEALTAKLHINESESMRLKLALAQLLTREATVNAVTAFDSSDGAGIDVANAAKLEALFRKSSDIALRAHAASPALLDATSQTEGWARETGPNMPSKWKKGESIGSGWFTCFCVAVDSRNPQSVSDVELPELYPLNFHALL